MEKELNQGLAFVDLLFVATVLGQIGVLSVRRWAGEGVPDYSGWKAQHILHDQRFRFALALMLLAAWTSVAIALIRNALKSAVIPLLATHLGPLPIPQWLALVLQVGHWNGLTFVLWATAVWLDRSISRKWSQDTGRAGWRTVGFPMLLTLFALALSVSPN
jgi:hypothetical protein